MYVKNWKDEVAEKLVPILKAKSKVDREEAIDELLDTVEDIVITSYLLGRTNGELALNEEGAQDE
jgi:hypothetical protein